MKLYKIKADWIYGQSEENTTKREAQISALEKVGLSGKEIDGAVIGTSEQVLDLILLKYNNQYTSSEGVKLVFEQTDELGLQPMIDKSLKKSAQSLGQLFNQKTNSEQPNDHLMRVTQTLLLEDGCTELLQEKLSQNWRIIAVCPQPHRRPDYILGRAYLPINCERG